MDAEVLILSIVTSVLVIILVIGFLYAIYAIVRISAGKKPVRSRDDIFPGEELRFRRGENTLILPTAITRWGMRIGVRAGEVPFDVGEIADTRQLRGARFTVTNVAEAHVELELIETATSKCRFPIGTRFMYDVGDYRKERSAWRKRMDAEGLRERSLQQFRSKPD